MRQLFATKSIDKLIAESERPEHALQKTLGPVSLTALGIGAVIGSGIFTVIGTAIAGEKLADTSSILHAPVADLPDPSFGARGPARGGPRARPFARPGRHHLRAYRALLCGARKHDPHRRLGLHLHLRHHGRAHRVDHRLGPDPRVRGLEHERLGRLRRPRSGPLGLVRRASLSPSGFPRPTFREACRTSPAKTSTPRDSTSASNIPAFLIVLLLTVVLVRGIRESARTNNIMVLVKMGGILLFIGFGRLAIRSSPSNYHPFSPNGFSGSTGGRIDHLLHLHRLRFRLDRKRGMQKPPAAMCPSGSSRR